MPTDIRVPTLGESVTEATNGQWFKKVGDRVEADEPLVELETDKVTLSVTSPDNGTAAEEVPADYRSDSFEIGFNANYLKDILHQIDGDTVELHLADPGAPTLIRQDDKSSALYVLMPMRV